MELWQLRLVRCILSAITLWWFHMQIMHHIFPPSRHHHHHHQTEAKPKPQPEKRLMESFVCVAARKAIENAILSTSIKIQTKHRRSQLRVLLRRDRSHGKRCYRLEGNLIATGCCQKHCNEDDDSNGIQWQHQQLEQCNM